MQRNKMKDLLQWREKGSNLPLLLLGARQVGKTFLIQEFARQYYENALYINFEREPKFKSIFDKDLVPERLILELELIFMRKIDPVTTLIIFDEIQMEMRAVTALKYFAEMDRSYSIIGAGSLLGVALEREQFSFPVGKVEMHNLYPFTFDEFLCGVGFEMYVATIASAFANNEPLPDIVHERLLDQYVRYLYVGGMPAAINEYNRIGQDIVTFDRSVQENIINAYIADMSKYTSRAEVLKVQAIYKSIPNQLAGDYKKFKYALVERGAKALTYGTSIEWLLLNQVSLSCVMVNRGEVPLSVNQDLKQFKLYLSDVGLLMAMARIPFAIMAREEEHNLFKGAVTENFVAQQLKAKGYELYYWKTNAHEVDFLIQVEDKVLPIEVKASKNKRSRSLMEYIRTHESQQSIRISKRNFGSSGGIKSVPLYAVFCI